jgi:hypothetical protein
VKWGLGFQSYLGAGFDTPVNAFRSQNSINVAINRVANNKVGHALGISGVNDLTKFQCKMSHQLGHFLFVIIFPIEMIY